LLRVIHGTSCGTKKSGALRHSPFCWGTCCWSCYHAEFGRTYMSSGFGI